MALLLLSSLSVTFAQEDENPTLVYDVAANTLELVTEARNVPFDSSSSFFKTNQVVTLRIINGQLLAQYRVSITATEIAPASPTVRGMGDADTLSLGSVAGTPPTKSGAPIAAISVPTVDVRRAFRTLADEFETANLLVDDLPAIIAALRRGAAELDNDLKEFSSELAEVSGTQDSDCDAPRLGTTARQVQELLHCLAANLQSTLGSYEEGYDYTDADEFAAFAARTDTVARQIQTLNQRIDRAAFETKLSVLRQNASTLATKIEAFARTLRTYQVAIILFGAIDDQAFEIDVMVQEKERELNGSFPGQISADEMVEYMVAYREELLARLETETTPPTDGDLTDREKFDILGLVQELTRLSGQLIGMDSPDARIAAVRAAFSTFENVVASTNADIALVFSRMNTLYGKGRRAEPLDIVLGQWNSNHVIRFEVLERENFTRYGLVASRTTTQTGPGSISVTPAASAAAAAAAGGGGATPAAGNAQTPTPAPTPGVVTPVTNDGFAHLATHSFDVHQVFRWNVIGGFAFSSYKDYEYVVRPVERRDDMGGVEMKDGEPVTDPVPFLAGSNPQFHYFVGANIYIVERDLFPGALTPKQRFVPGAMIALPIGQPDNLLIGANWEPIIGLDFAFGWHIGKETVLQDGIEAGGMGTRLPAATTEAPTREQRRYNGFYFSIGFDLNIFRRVFGGVTGVGVTGG